MQGFMKKAGLLEYCLPIRELSANNLSDKFESMIDNYTEYKNVLAIKKAEFKKESSKTTELVCQILNK
jgi:colanic acid/amylovoran biosynthesis protein